MKHLKIFETYKSQRELEKLTNDIIKAIAKNTYDITKDLWDRNEDDPQMRGVFHNLIGLREVSNHIDGGEYDELKKFVELFPLEIKLSRTNIRGNKDIKGSFTTKQWKDGIWYKGGIIVMRYYDEIIGEITKQRNEYLDKGWEWAEGEIYFKIWYEFKETLLHELQHAYDEYRSKGEYARDKKSRKHYGEQDTISNIKQKKGLGMTLSDSEKDKIINNASRYYKLRHEVDARFAQAIHNTRFIGSDMIDVEGKNKDGEENDMIFVYKMKPFKEVLSSFKVYFEGWRSMTPKIQKRLLQKLGKFYELSKPEMVAKNKQEHERVYGKK